MRVLRVIGWILLSLLTLTAAAILAALLLARSERGHRAILSTALPQIRQQLDGKIEIGRLEGDVIRDMILYDIIIYDLDRREAVRIARLAIRWDPIALVDRRLQVSEARAEGVRVHARPLEDGRLNLAALLKPGEGPSRWGFSVARAFVDGEVEWREASRATVSLRGGAQHSPDRGLRLDAVELTVATTGASIARLYPDAPLQGPFNARLRADGTLEALRADLTIEPPRGRITVDGVVNLSARGPVWNLRLRAEDIDPAAAWRGAPAGRIQISADGRGRGARGTVEIDRALATVAATRASVRGRITLARTVEGNLHLNLEARDLSRLAAFGMPGLAGQLSARANVIRKAGHLRVDGEAHGVALQVAGNQVRRLDARVHTDDLEGKLTLRAFGVTGVNNMRLDRLLVQASGDPKALRAHIEGHGPRNTEILLDAHGTPLLQKSQVRGADIIIDRARVSLRGETWASGAPARLRVAHTIAVENLQLASQKQRLSLDGRWTRSTDAVDARVRAEHLDLALLGHLAAPQKRFPTTDAQLEARIGGTAHAPIVQLALDGTMGSEWPKRTRYHARLRYADERVSGNFEARAVGERIFARVDLPIKLDGERPLRAEVQIDTASLERLRRFLPPKLLALDAKGHAAFKLDGTTRHPVVDASLDFDSFKLGSLDGGRLQAKLHYDGVAEAQIDLGLNAGARRIGALRATGRVPVDLIKRRLSHDAPVELDVIVDGADLEALPLAQFGITHPLRSGIVDGRARVRGTLHDPDFEIAIDAQKLATTQVSEVGARAKLVWTNAQPTLHAEIDLRGGTLLVADGRAQLSFGKLVDGQPWRDAPVEIEGRFPDYDLARLPEAAGKLRGGFRAHGTIAKLQGEIDASADGLALGGSKFERAAILGRFDGATVTAALVMDQTLRLDATVPLQKDQPLRAVLVAKNFELHLKPRGFAGLRQLDFVANGELAITGTRARPRVGGRLIVDKGQLALAGDPRLYTDGKLDVAISGDKLELRQLALSVGGGKLQAKGSAVLDGIFPTQFDLQATARRFPVNQGQVGAWVDADVALRGTRSGPRTLSGELVVQKGTAQLPKISSRRSLQSLDPLEDVEFVDERARREREERQRAVERGLRGAIVARIPGPFHVRSPELNTDLKGELLVELAGPDSRITGTVEAEGGWFELLDRRYDIERARFGFGGPPDDPGLDVRITRQISEATVIVELHGTAKQPKLVLTSDPPIYDQSQMLGILVSGDPGTARVSSRSMDQKVIGALSGFIVGKLKDQIAPGLPIDVLKVDVGSEGYAGFTSTRVEVGKYITENIYVSYVHQFGTTQIGTRRINANQAQVEYRFKRQFQIDTMFGDAGVGAIDFYWLLRF